MLRCKTWQVQDREEIQGEGAICNGNQSKELFCRILFRWNCCYKSHPSKRNRGTGRVRKLGAAVICGEGDLMFSSPSAVFQSSLRTNLRISGVYAPDGSSHSHPSVTIKNVSTHCQVSPRGGGSQITSIWEALLQGLASRVLASKKKFFWTKSCITPSRVGDLTRTSMFCFTGWFGHLKWDLH